MQEQTDREQDLQRLTASDISPRDPYYIATYFINRDVSYAAKKYAAGNLLDIGCGNKPYQKAFACSIQSYIGCDVVQSSEKIVDVLCPANQLSFPDRSFDTVFSSQVMEHVEDFQGMISEAYRVLRSDGYAIFTVPFCWELHEEPHDYHRFSKHALKHHFEAAGFELIEIKANGGKWAALFQLGLNVLFSTRKYRTIRSRFIKLLFIHFRFLYLYNKLGVLIDKRFYDAVLTLNYIVIARKK